MRKSSFAVNFFCKNSIIDIWLKHEFDLDNIFILVLQYGFVTMFVAAFPLAPFVALLNNMVEIRLDAVNFIHNFRRPAAERAEDIGAWYGILASLTMVSIGPLHRKNLPSLNPPGHT